MLPRCTKCLFETEVQLSDADLQWHSMTWPADNQALRPSVPWLEVKFRHRENSLEREVKEGWRTTSSKKMNPSLPSLDRSQAVTPGMLLLGTHLPLLLLWFLPKHSAITGKDQKAEAIQRKKNRERGVGGQIFSVARCFPSFACLLTLLAWGLCPWQCRSEWVTPESCLPGAVEVAGCSS